MRTMLLVAVMLFPVAAAGQELRDFPTAATDAEHDRFALYTGCMAIYAGGLVEDDDDGMAHLSADAVSRAVTSRVRGARLYAEPPSPVGGVLEVYVHVASRSVAITTEFSKVLRDPLSRLRYTATTWTRAATGLHGRDAGFVLGAVSQQLDTFIDEYLRVNAAACERLQPLGDAP